MAAARFSSDVLEMFYGLQLQPPLRPSRDFDFNLVRTNFHKWLCTWKIVLPFDYKFKADRMIFTQKTKAKFEKVV